MNDIKYIFCDIDGTLLRRGEMLQDSFIQKIRQMKEKGYYFTFASGRLPYMIQPILEDLELDNAYYVSCNGALVRNKEKVLFVQKFPLSLVSRLIDLALKYNMTVLYAVDEEEFLLQENSATIRKRAERGRYHPLRKVTSDEFATLKILKMNILTDDSEQTISILHSELSELVSELNITRYGDYGVEIVAKNVNKLTGVQLLLSHLDGQLIQSCAIGDNENDAQLIEAVQLGIAVGNATEELKDVADVIMKQEASQGVVEALTYIDNLKREKEQI